MIKVSLIALRSAAKHRPKGYYDEVISRGRIEGDILFIEDESYILLRKKYGPKPEPWPMVLLPMKMFAKEGDRGAGDIIARVIGPIGGNAFKLWYKNLIGKDCGCGNRQETLNARWPL